MCSVSFIPNTGGFFVAMNRDESHARPLARLPECHALEAAWSIFPAEPGGGTWIGVNDCGICMALINWYAVPYTVGQKRRSRGSLIPGLLNARSSGEVWKQLPKFSLPECAPFRLLLFASPESTIFEFRWDGQTLELRPETWEPRHWFSSGFDEPEAQRRRGDVCMAAQAEAGAGSLNWLRRLHGSHEPSPGPFSMCMHRSGASTVSYTEVTVGAERVSMSYHAAPLCRSAKPDKSLSIPRVSKGIPWFYSSRRQVSVPSHVP